MSAFIEIGPRIVCAALLYEGGLIVCGPRHFDTLMHPVIARFAPTGRPVQGFVDQRGKFYTRKEAHALAVENGQVQRRVGGDDDTLYSENLY